MWFTNRREERPWGYFVTYISTQKFTVKDLVIKSGQALSLQYHNNRDEVWAWIDGPAPRITIGARSFYMERGQSYTIPRRTSHRIENLSNQGPATVLEVAYGRFDEDDIVRLEDRYGRD